MRAQEFISENIKDQTQASGEKVLAYINSIHPDGLTPRMSQAVLKHPQYQLQRVPLTSLHIPDQDLDDPDQDPLVDPYDRVMVVDPAHADEYSSNFIDRRPIVVDANGFILDGNHRAWAAAWDGGLGPDGDRAGDQGPAGSGDHVPADRHRRSGGGPHAAQHLRQRHRPEGPQGLAQPGSGEGRADRPLRGSRVAADR